LTVKLTKNQDYVNRQGRIYSEDRLNFGKFEKKWENFLK